MKLNCKWLFPAEKEAAEQEAAELEERMAKRYIEGLERCKDRDNVIEVNERNDNR